VSTQSPIEVHRSPHLKLLFFGLGLLVLAVLVSVALYVHNPESVPALPWYLAGPGPGFIGAIIGGFVGAGAKSLIFNRLLTYYPQTKTVEARDRFWGLWKEFPCEGFDRLEYEAATGKLFEVRSEGKRRQVPVNRGEAVREEWRTFVEQFERDHAPIEPDSS
jgi:hypothetical protein